MPNLVARILPAALLAAGYALLLKVGAQSATPLAGPLDRLPQELMGYVGHDQVVSEAEQRVAGMDDYLMRAYVRDSADYFSLYVGYYQAQTQGKTIHSPKNCLPGAGWEPVESRPFSFTAAGRTVTVNRYVMEKGNSRVIVFYWYQGRGRVAWNEFGVKWELLRDKAVHGRSEESLVRIVVPVVPGAPGIADSLATRAAREVIPALFGVLAPLETNSAT